MKWFLNFFWNFLERCYNFSDFIQFCVTILNTSIQYYHYISIIREGDISKHFWKLKILPKFKYKINTYLKWRIILRNYKRMQKMFSRALSCSKGLRKHPTLLCNLKYMVKPVHLNAMRSFSTLPNSALYQGTMGRVSQLYRSFSLYAESKQTPFLEKIEMITSFENAVGLISVYLMETDYRIELSWAIFWRKPSCIKISRPIFIRNNFDSTAPSILCCRWLCSIFEYRCWWIVSSTIKLFVLLIIVEYQ